MVAYAFTLFRATFVETAVYKPCFSWSFSSSFAGESLVHNDLNQRMGVVVPYDMAEPFLGFLCLIPSWQESFMVRQFFQQFNFLYFH